MKRPRKCHDRIKMSKYYLFLRGTRYPSRINVQPTHNLLTHPVRRVHARTQVWPLHAVVSWLQGMKIPNDVWSSLVSQRIRVMFTSHQVHHWIALPTRTLKKNIKAPYMFASCEETNPISVLKYNCSKVLLLQLINIYSTYCIPLHQQLKPVW